MKKILFAFCISVLGFISCSEPDPNPPYEVFVPSDEVTTSEDPVSTGKVVIDTLDTVK
jgi:hypothetical protein